MSVIRKIFLVMLGVFILNVILAYSYIHFFIIDDINKNYYEASVQYKAKLNSIINNELKDVTLEELTSKLEIITKQYNSIMTVRDINNNYIYDNSADESDNSIYLYEASSLIEIGDKTYAITFYEETTIYNTEVVAKVILGELVIIYLIGAICITIGNNKFIVPILNLKHDIDSYKYGVRPKKRAIKTETDELQNSYVELVDDLEEEKQKQNRIIASISHDIKTPLTAIVGYSERLTSTKLPEETQNKYVEKIHNKSLVMKDIVEEFDDYLSCNIKNTLKKDKVKIGDFLENIKNDYKDDLEEKDITLKVNCNCKDDEIVFDILKIKRVFSNIIGNSVRHLDKDKKKIDVSCIKKDGYYEFCVADNGCGVSEESLHKIFEPLYTTDPSRKIPGLGLSICKEIVEIHDGEIFAKNNSNGGLSIYFILF